MHPTSSSIHISKCIYETSGNRSETSMDFVLQDFYEEAMTAACMHDVRELYTVDMEWVSDRHIYLVFAKSRLNQQWMPALQQFYSVPNTFLQMASCPHIQSGFWLSGVITTLYFQRWIQKYLLCGAHNATTTIIIIKNTSVAQGLVVYSAKEPSISSTKPFETQDIMSRSLWSDKYTALNQSGCHTNFAGTDKMMMGNIHSFHLWSVHLCDSQQCLRVS